MRNPLEYIQVIDKYLRGILSEEDNRIFENRLKTDITLQTEVTKQKLLMEGIKRDALKISAKKGLKSHKMIKSLKTIGTIVLIATIATASYFILNNNEGEESNKTESSITNPSTPIFEGENFELNTQKDTVIETENGLVLAIPSNAFETQNGEEVTGNITFKTKEAFEDYDIIKAGLTTTSNGRLLETGGMFFLSASQNGKELKLKNGKEILSQIPNLHPEKEMMLFDGIKDAKGNINWVNPKQFEKDLLTVDVTTLDFYPEGYLEELNTEEIIVWTQYKGNDTSKLYFDTIPANYNNAHFESLSFNNNKEEGGAVYPPNYKKVKTNNYPKHFTDSLYYSFARLFEKREIESEEYPVGISYNEKELNIKLEDLIFDDTIESTDDYYIVIDSRYGKDRSPHMYVPINQDTISTIYSSCPIPSGINPAKIKAIWNKKFNKTTLATREFEQRIKVIHQTREDRILKIYIQNIDKPLWYSDSVAATRTDGKFKNKFLTFYKQRKGGVKLNDRLADNLGAYFDKKQKEFTKKSADIFNKYQTEKIKLRQEFANKKSAKQQEEYKRKAEVFDEEYKMNLCDAYRQLGKKGCRNRTNPPRLTARISTLGPKNVDYYVYQSTKNRETLNYTDPVTGKKAVIKYEPMKVKILNTEKFDKVFVYLLPDSLSSFNRMKSTDNINFSLNLNELLNYKLVCLAYQGEKVFFVEIPKVIPKNYEVTLTISSEEKVKNSLDATSKLLNTNFQKDIESDMNFYNAGVDFGKKQKKFKRDKELTLRIGKFLFPMLEEKCFGYYNYPESEIVNKANKANKKQIKIERR